MVFVLWLWMADPELPDDMWQLVYPLSSFPIVFVIESFVEALDYHAVRPLNLTIGLWVCNRNIFDLQNWLAVKFDPRSVMMVFGKPKRCKMSEMKSTTLSGVSLAIGLYSIHLVNLSIASNT
jgi:hypothetical protein